MEHDRADDRSRDRGTRCCAAPRSHPRTDNCGLRPARARLPHRGTNGLFLALGAGLVGSELGGSTHTHAGIVIFALAISGITASSVLQRRSARTISLYATSALAFGTAASIVALALGSYPAYVVSVAIVGSGFGTAFLGVLRTLMPHTASSERAAVMAVIYTVAYLAFGVPTIVAGLLVPVLTLSGTMTVLGAIIIALSLAATVLRLRIP